MLQTPPNDTYASRRTKGHIHRRGPKAVLAVLSGVAAVAGAGVAPVFASGVTYRTVALTGQQVPGADPGVVFQSLGTGLLNDRGEVAFGVRKDGPGTDLFIDGELFVTGVRRLESRLQAGDPFPAQETQTIRFVVPEAFNNAGQVAVQAGLTGPGVEEFNDLLLGLVSADGVDFSAREGSPIPVESDLTYLWPSTSFNGDIRYNDPFWSTSIRLNDAGQLLFQSALAPVDAGDESGFGSFRVDASEVSTLLKSGDVLPDFPGLEVRSVWAPNLNQDGSALLSVRLREPGVTEYAGSALYISSNDSLTLLAQSGDPIAGIPGKTVGKFFWTSGKNESGQFAFYPSIGEFELGLPIDYHGLLIGTSIEDATLAFQFGDPAPGLPGFKLDSPDSDIGTPLVNDAGDALVWVRVTEEGGDSFGRLAGYFVGSEGMRLIGVQGEPLPSSDSDATLGFPQALFVNNAGQIYVSVFGDGKDGEGIIHPDGSFDLLVQEGESIDVDPSPNAEDLREVSRILDSDFNDFGEVLMRIRFTDDSEGLFVFSAMNLLSNPGDGNRDGVVDLIDFHSLAVGYGYVTPSGPIGGDFNGDGVVDLLDFDILAQNFGSSSPGVVPEPASVALLGLAGPMLFRGRGRRRRG